MSYSEKELREKIKHLFELQSRLKQLHFHMFEVFHSSFICARDIGVMLDSGKDKKSISKMKANSKTGKKSKNKAPKKVVPKSKKPKAKDKDI